MKYECQDNSADYAEVSKDHDRVQIRVRDAAIYQCKSDAAITPSDARAFAAEILRIADEIEPPKEETMSTKKPIEFAERSIGRLIAGQTQDGELQFINNMGNGVWFHNDELTAARKALDDYEAAVKKANTLTLGDLAVGDWFELAEKENALAIPGPLFVVSHGEYSSFGSIAGHRYRWEPSTPVRRLKATFEVVE
jgi:hypothetical protein